MGELALLSWITALNPSLIAAATVMLLLPRPARLMLGYWLGAMLTGTVSGLVVVFALSGTSTSAGQTTKNTVSLGVDLALAALALVAVLILATRRDKPPEGRRAKRKNGNKPPKWQQTMAEGTARTTFVIGILLWFPVSPISLPSTGSTNCTTQPL